MTLRRVLQADSSEQQHAESLVPRRVNSAVGHFVASMLRIRYQTLVFCAPLLIAACQSTRSSPAVHHYEPEAVLRAYFDTWLITTKPPKDHL